MRGRKISVDNDGNIMWATNIEKDPKEKVNIAEISNIQMDKEWKEIIEWGRGETIKRKKGSWIWRDLLKNRYDQT